VAVIIWTQGDVWWPATVLLFGPRWLFLLPAIPVALAALLIRPRLLIPIAAALLIALGPLMGFRTGWRRWLGGAPPRAIRIISFNIEGQANPMLLQVPAYLERYGADVVVFQECPERMAEPSLWPAGWTAHRNYGGLCLATRFPIVEIKVLERLEAGVQGGTGNAALFRLRTDRGIIDVVALHLETPRKGLAPLRREGTSARLRANIEIRDVGARRISRWIQTETLNPIIAGDLNLPVESRIYRAYFGHCTNSFSVAGRGFGWTRVLNRFSVRIDHVLGCGAWRPLSAEVGPDLGSDHLPLIADLGVDR
jgi:vancomycin resistance protein VanJ